MAIFNSYVSLPEGNHHESPPTPQVLGQRIVLFAKAMMAAFGPLSGGHFNPAVSVAMSLGGNHGEHTGDL